MRQPEDQSTLELPGFPPPPAKPERTTKAVRRLAAGFEWPRERTDNCRHCRHAAALVHNPDAFNESVSLRCKLGDFPTAPGARCEEFEA